MIPIHLVEKQQLFKYFSILGVLFGGIVRLIQYLSNRSLWSDEAMVALNIVDRTYLELLKPLDYNQAAPPGFLWIEKAAVQLLGNNEYALRLFPFLSGIVALIAFYIFANRYASGIAAPIAIALFASLKYVLYYTTEVKQYSSDIMSTLLLCLFLIPLHDHLLSRRQLILLGLLGAGLIWISHPTVIVIAGIEIGYFLIATNRQRLKILANRWPMYLTWLASFLLLYGLTIRGTLENESLAYSWSERYPDSPLDITWLCQAIQRFFSNPLGFPNIINGVALIIFLTGCIAFYQKNKSVFLGITSPFIVTIILAELHQYPFRQRLVLFLVPLAVLIIAEGIVYLYSKLKQKRQAFASLAIFIAFALLTPPLVSASQLLIHPITVEETRSAIAYIRTHQQPGDKLYIYRGGKVQFMYYAPKFGYQSNDYVLGKPTLALRGRNNKLSETGVKQFQRELAQFKGESRVWFLCCNLSKVEEKAFLEMAGKMGQQLDSFKQPKAFVYLYSFKEPYKNN